MFSTIVVGVDGQRGGRDALSLAQRLQQHGGGQLVAVHVAPLEPMLFPALTPDLDELTRDAIRAVLAAEIASAGIQAREVAATDTSPARALHRVAEELHADLVVIGSSHRGAIGRVLAGDTVRGVLQGSSQPVVVAPHGVDDSLSRRVIGVGYDGSPESEAALGWASRLGVATDATIRIVSVVQPPQAFAASVTYGLTWVDAVPEREESARKLQADALARLDLGDRATGDVVVGMPDEELRRVSGEVDVLVLGSRGYGAVRRVLLGSTSDRVVHDAACAVVVVPRGIADAPADESSTEVGARV